MYLDQAEIHINTSGLNAVVNSPSLFSEIPLAQTREVKWRKGSTKGMKRMEKKKGKIGDRGQETVTPNLCQVQQQDSGMSSSDISILIKVLKAGEVVWQGEHVDLRS